jgi:hypothetical protein
MQPSDDWKQAIKKWYESNGLSEPRDHDTPSVSDNLGPGYTASETVEIFDLFDKSTQPSSQVRQSWIAQIRERLGPLQLQSLQPRATLGRRAKPRLTAADIIFLRDMKVGL